MEHSHAEDSLNFTCSLEGCTVMYRSVVAYRKHLSRAHSSHWNFCMKKEQTNNEQVAIKRKMLVDDDVGGVSSSSQPNDTENTDEAVEGGRDSELKPAMLLKILTASRRQYVVVARTKEEFVEKGTLHIHHVNC